MWDCRFVFSKSSRAKWLNAKKLYTQLQEQSTEVILIDLKMNAMKPLSARWLVSMFTYFKNNTKYNSEWIQGSWHYKLLICIVML